MSINLISITDSWGTKKGGINSFNYDFLCSLANLSLDIDISIFCVVLSASDMDQENALSNRVKLIDLQSEKFNNNLINHILNFFDSNESISFFIGHDIISGKFAYDCKKKALGNSKCIVFHHMVYEHYESLKKNYNPLGSDLKVENQIEIFKNADYVFGVGPKLFESALDLVGDKHREKCKMFIPGFPEIKVNENYPKVFRAVSSGRLEYYADYIKLFSLAVCALHKAKIECGEGAFHTDSTINLVGLDKDSNPDDIDNMKQHINNQLSRCGMDSPKPRFNFIPYKESREKIYEILKRSSVSLMLSIHEGFGLSGWEAIAAGIPLIITKNSGLYQFLEESYANQASKFVYSIDIKGDLDNIFSIEDLTSVSEAIKTIHNKQAHWKKNALSLRKLMRNKYPWDKVSVDFLSKIGIKTKKDNMKILTKVVTPHENYGSTHLLKKATKRVWLDAIFYPYYSKTGDEQFYRKLISKNADAEVCIIFPSEKLISFKNELFSGYAEILRKGEFGETELLKEVQANISAFKSIKQSLEESNRDRFILLECDQIIFHPFVLIDNTLLVGHFSHSPCVAPYGAWLMSEIQDKDIYCKDALDLEYGMNQALKRYIDEFNYRRNISKEIK